MEKLSFVGTKEAVQAEYRARGLYISDREATEEARLRMNTQRMLDHSERQMRRNVPSPLTYADPTGEAALTRPTRRRAI